MSTVTEVVVQDVSTFGNLDMDNSVRMELQTRLIWAIAHANDYFGPDEGEFQLTLSPVKWDEERQGPLPLGVIWTLDCGFGWMIQAADSNYGIGYVGKDNGSGVHSGVANAYFWSDRSPRP